MNQELIKHFSLSESDLTVVKNELRPDQSIFDVLFEKKMLDPASYLEWAKGFFNLPVLKEEFLKSGEAKIFELLDRYKNVFPKQVIPFHEWDGVLYVMCLEPVQFQAPQPVQFVLAPYEVIQKYSLKNETKIAAQQEIVMPVEKELTNPIFKTLSAEVNQPPKVDAPSFNFEMPTGFTPVQLLSDGVPAGMDFPDTPSEKEDFETEEPVTSVDLSEESDGAPAGLTGFQPQVAIPLPLPEDMPPPPPPAKVEDPFEEPPTKLFDVPSFASPSAPAAPQPTAQPVVEFAPPAPPSLPVMPPPMEVPPYSVAPSVAMGDEDSNNSSVPNFTLSKIIAPNGPFTATLESMKKYFTQCMVLTFKNGILSPEVWDDTWYKQPHAQAAIDVSSPSIFRIVCETQQSYHGHVISNQINDSFFNTWNRGQYPQHITLCPMASGKNLFGMVLGITSKENAKKFQLHHIEEIALAAVQAMQSPKAA